MPALITGKQMIMSLALQLASAVPFLYCPVTNEGDQNFMIFFFLVLALSDLASIISCCGHICLL